MESVRTGTRLAYSECQYQFRHRRWNCTMINPKTYEVFGEAILKKGTQEAAFVHAITAAGVAYQLTTDCSKGLISICGCDQTAQMNNNDPKKYVFSGCSDNVRYGTLSSKEFVDAGDRGKHKNNSVQRAMNLHNNNAGREVLIQNIEEKCKCHGMSGSCNMKTCYKKMPSFRKVGAILKEKFDGATEVNVELEESRPVITRRDLQFKKHTKADLVYSDPSPDFCEPDPENGVLGTHGRQCNTSSLFPDECSQLCCNRGYRTYKRRIQRECHCKFVYCCHVECEICTTTVSEEICN
ncbi:unnamed protein product [Enterobius vermicularis]|uniref:Protein Wnt n=1 Tax=Enterobius vermicularis TaxID=51028 RepID=A0A0N4VR07_ENTVE|nr:unnamed protein product [Enterobius vermicularis]